MADTTKTLRLAILADSSTAEQAFAKLQTQVKNTGVSVAAFNTQLHEVDGVKQYYHYISLASESLKKLEEVQKSIVKAAPNTSQQGAITSNALKDEIELAKKKADLASKSSADMVAKAKASVTAQLIAIREGENSIAAVKNASAERQKQIETNLQEKLKSIRDRYAAGAFNKGSLDLSIKSITDAYQRQTISLAVETDKRIAKIKEEQAAQEAYSRSLIGRLSSAPRYTPPTSMISGMSEAGRAASASAAAATIRPLAPIPPVPQETRSSYDSLFARIGAINIEYRLWNATINTVLDSLRAIPKIGIELDATRAVLTATMGSEAGVSSALKALDEEAKRTGITIGALRESFRTFHASTSLAGESLQDTWTMFTNLNTVSTALHLTTDQTNHVFLAMAQIFNKSKVQSEELVKQLGNLLPGAFAMFAKSMGISTMELSKQMKDGLVFAHDTMKDFTQFMSDRFAASFAVASDGLNANLGRMQSSFTQLGEAIYASSKGPMNSAVKTITEVTTALKEDVQGQNKFIAAIQDTANAIGGVLVGALLAALPNLATMKASFEALILSIRGAGAAAATTRTSLLSLGDTAVIAVLTTVALKFTEIGREQAAVYADASARFKALQQEKIKADLGKPLEVRVEASENVGTAKKQLAEIKTEWDAILKAKNEGAKFRETDLGLQPIAAAEARIASAYVKQQDLLQKTREAETLAINKWDKENRQKILNLGDLSTTEIGSMHVAALKAAGKTVEAAGEEFDNSHKKALDKSKQDVITLTKAIEDERKAATPNVDFLKDYQTKLDEANKYIADATVARAGVIKDAQERLDKQTKSGAKSAATERLRGIKEEIGQVKEYQRTAANDAENQIKLLDEQNKAKTYSFEEYARRKKEILTKDYEAEKAWYEQQKALAASSGKKGLVTQAEEQLKRLKADYEAKVGTKTTAGIIDTETTKNLQDYETNINMIHEKYRDILGLERDSNDLTSVKLELIRKQLELEATEKGEQGEKAKRILEELRVLKEAQNLRANFEVHAKNLSSAEKLTSDILQRNNELRQTGNMTELQYLMSNTKAKEKLIKLSEQEVKAMKEALDTASPEARPAAQAKYDLAVQRLESLKLVADETGAFIESSLGTAFEKSFEGLITKSMTASQAFKAFANSVAGDIAKIIAQEMRSQIIGAILKPLAGAAWSGLTGAFSGSGMAEFSGNLSKAVGGSPFSGVGPYQSFANANGGVYSGAGISAHSGTIVSSPTVFPFAKGVGLMGEAGPEAILPLKRNSQGKLGVSVENAGQNKGNLYNITVNVQSKQGENPEQFGQRAATAMMRSIAKEEISNARRPGNTLNKARFG